MTNKSSDDTPRTDACPHCGAEPVPHPHDDPAWQEYRCGTVYGYYPSELCLEREARQKAESELEKLKAGKVFVDPKWIYDLETQLAKAHEELCQAGLREYGN